MVYDDVADKERDVDVTVTVSESGKPVRAFKAYEVKKEKPPLDVAIVEQLCAKLLDMPSVTHRAIVSSSGYTDAAIRKARRGKVELYELREWTRPLQEQFPALTMKGTAAECFPMEKILLCWASYRLQLVAREAKGNFNVESDDPLFAASGMVHEKFATFRALTNELLMRSTEQLFNIEPATTVKSLFPVPFTAPSGEIPAGPAWPHTHSLDVSADEVFIATPSGQHRLDLVTIGGYLQWQRPQAKPLYYVVEKVSDGSAFAGALVSMDLRPGQMTGLIFSPKTREFGVHFVRLAEKHQQAIRKLQLRGVDT
jgi:hypothetical protein